MAPKTPHGHRPPPGIPRSDVESLLGQDYVRWLRDLAARRRFGERDRLGTANLIDDAARARAAAVVRTGRSVGLARRLTAGESLRDDGTPAYRMEFHYTDGPVGTGSDTVHLDCHGPANTHVDAFNHLAIDGTWYGGWPVGDAAGPSVVDIADAGLVTRAFHADIAGVRGTPWVAANESVTGADIERALERADAAFEPGDALLLDMGRDRYEQAGQPAHGSPIPGLGIDGARWVLEHDVSILCWDFVDAIHPSEPRMTAHGLHWAIGLVLVDNCSFAALRERFPGGPAVGALVLAPLPMAGASGCNVNPTLMF